MLIDSGDIMKIIHGPIFDHQFSLVFVYLVCGPRQLFSFPCGPETPKGWTRMLETEARKTLGLGYTFCPSLWGDMASLVPLLSERLLSMQLPLFQLHVAFAVTLSWTSSQYSQPLAVFCLKKIVNSYGKEVIVPDYLLRQEHK